MTCKRFSSYITCYPWLLSATLLFITATASCNLYLPQITRNIIDDLTGATPEQALNSQLVLYAGISIIGVLLSYGSRFFPLRIGHLAETAIRDEVFRHLTTLDRSYYRANQTGDLMTRMSSDLRLIAMGIGQSLLQLTRTAITLAGAYYIMFRENVVLTILLIAVMPLMIVSFAFTVRIVKARHVKAQEQLSELSSRCQEAFSGIRTIKAFSIEPRWSRVFRAENEGLFETNLSLSKVHMLIPPMAGFWTALSLCTLLVAGGIQINRQQMTIGELVQFTQYLFYIQWPLMTMGWITNLIQRSRASWTRVRDILATEPTIYDHAECTPIDTESSPAIDFDHISYSDNGETLLHDITLHVPSGESVGITGPTGSGKTLLVSMLVRLIDPTAGCIRMNSKDIAKMPLHELRRMTGYADQEPTLFSETLENNIRFGNPTASENDVQTATHAAHLNNDISDMPSALQTMLGERGITLSGGQRQRASISRAIVCNPLIYIFDDVLASVDTETEAAIISNLHDVFEHRTVFLVSHRITALRKMDRILIIENGRITQQGSHDTLVHQKGYYQNLCKIQEIKGDML